MTMARAELEKQLSDEIRAADKRIQALKAQIKKATEDLSYWERQAEALSTVSTRIQLENTHGTHE
jgi:hypothetical protein